MKKYIFIFYILFSFFNVFAEESHYKNLSKIEMDVLRNDKVIGYSNYFFKYDGRATEYLNRKLKKIKR